VEVWQTSCLCLRRLRLGEERKKLEMLANAQRDGRSTEYRWRPLFNAAKFGYFAGDNNKANQVSRRC